VGSSAQPHDPVHAMPTRSIVDHIDVVLKTTTSSLSRLICQKARARWQYAPAMRIWADMGVATRRIEERKATSCRSMRWQDDDTCGSNRLGQVSI
jgi:hypothetical protein